MHLGLIDGPFVPHNLISTQESPVPLLKFHIAPRLKILMASGSKKGTFLFSQKSRQTNPHQVPQQGHYGERGLFTGHFAHLSKTSSFGFPSKGALPQGPLCGIPRRDSPPLEPSFIHISKSPVYKGPLPRPTYQVPLGWKGPPWREMPISGDFLNISSRVPSEGALPPRLPPQSLFRERSSIPRAPFIHLSKSLVDEPSSMFPKRGPYGKRCPSPSLFYLTFRVPITGALPPGSLHRTPTESDAPPLEPLSTISQSLWKISPLEVAQHNTHEERSPFPEPSFHNPKGP